MTRIETRLRLLWRTLACATLASSLSGCGGGGGSAPAPPPPPPPPASESAYLLAEFVAADGNHQHVRVWDPAQPSVAVQDVALVMSNGVAWASSHLVFSDARTYDAATRTFTTLGHAKVFFDNDGKLFSIDLRGGQSHVPVRLSSAVDVFMPVGATPMNAAGDDAWVDAQGGSHDWAIRTTMSATTAPVSELQVVAPLRDAATGMPQAFFAALGAHVAGHFSATTYQVFDASFTPVQVPAVAAMVASDTWVGVDPAQAGLGYVSIAGHLRALRWSSSGVTVDADPLYDFSAPGLVASTADAQSLWFNDGVALVAVANGVARQAGTFSQVPSRMVDAGDTVAASELTTLSVIRTATQVETIRKTDGHLRLVASADSDVVLLGASDQGLVIAGTSGAARAVSLVSGDTAHETTLGASLQFVGAVRSASARMDQPAAPVAVLACVAGPVDGFCAPGSLTQVALSGSSMAVGNLAATASWVRVDAIAGVASTLAGQTFLGGAGGFGDDETDHRDAWQFTPSASGSLTRITSYLP